MPSTHFLPLFDPSSELASFSPRKKSSPSVKPNVRPNPKRASQADHANRVLLLGRVHELALYRAEVLRDRGFEVRTSTDKDQAADLIRRGDFDALVLSYTLSSDTVQELAEEMREHCPHCALVVIAQTDHPDRRVAPDAIALANDGPKALVAALRRVLRRH